VLLRRQLLNCLIALAVFADLSAVALDWQQYPGHRRASLAITSGGKTGFIVVEAAAAGIAFTNRLSEERSLTNQIFLNGSGVAAGDVDGDGLCDLYFCGLDSPNALYRNLGNWRFADITTYAGVACADQASTGAAFADMDGDGTLDLLVNGIARGTRLFLNDGKGRFSEATAESGLRGTSGSASMALADIDGDGLLDLYVVNYRIDTMRDMPDIRFSVGVTNGVSQLLTVNGRPASAPDLVGRFSFDNRGGVLENGEADILFRNAGNGHFVPVSWTNGAFLSENGEPVRTPYEWGLSAMFRDLNDDRAPDLYVCNDFQSPDRIWINDGRGRFRAIARPAIRQTSLFSMGVDIADIDRDGFDDIFVADMLSREHARRQVQVMDPMAFAQALTAADDRPQFPRNTLFRNRGNGAYAELAQFAGLDASDWSWCPAFLDVDLDGFARSIAGEGDLARALANGRGRILRAPSLFEDAVKMLLTTNCSWAATKGMVVRMIAEAGAGGLAFPTPESVAALSVSKLKTKIRCGYRAESLARFARRVARGKLDLSTWERADASAEEIRAVILSEHGFGPYAAEGLLRLLGRHDYLALDSWVRQEYRRRYPGPRRTTDRAIARRYARYGAHRGLALWLDMTSHWHETAGESLRMRLSQVAPSLRS